MTKNNTQAKQQAEAKAQQQAEKEAGARLRGEKQLTVGDETYEVFFSVNAMINLQKKYGSIKVVFEEFDKGEDMDFDLFLEFLYQGVHSRNKDITKEELGDKIDFFDFGSVAQEVFGGAIDAMPSNEEDGE